ncbi:hypothetical protein [Hymenobacter sp. BT491]|uniref:hypothetical protein n=1 Tax=Hymenobacter sp. BT491 TaxID=2766779 RepID=UPI00165363CF|nr:hypothetical protein [Hymenobacter sp. BT491]MBC6990820.1 hypothetical protein [Hymenobacter sp. BT491]
MNSLLIKCKFWAIAVVVLLASATAGKAQGQEVTPALSNATQIQYYCDPSPEGPTLILTEQPHAIQSDNQQPSTEGPDQDGAGTVPAVEKSRHLSRTFPAVAGRLYALDTRYGRVQINTWGRNEIRTDVEIITRADTDEKAQQLQDMIQVLLVANDPATGGISAKSRFGLMPRACWSRLRLYEVNYTIWMPKNTPLRAYNSFGEISINGDLTGPTELAVEYGVLHTDRLEGAQNLVRVGNGQGTIAYARKAGIDASYSKLHLEAGQTVDLRNNYSDIDIGSVQNLTVHSKYGEVALGTVHNLSGTSGYSKFSIDKLRNQLDMTLQYCPAFEVRNTGKNFQRINLAGGFSTILLNFPDDAGFNFDVNTEHGKVDIDKRWVQLQPTAISASASDLQGKYGAALTKNSGNVNIKVHNGTVSFNR